MSLSLARALGACLVFTITACATESLRPPSVPLVAHDPYFSIWSPADKLTDADTVHWTGKPHRLTSLVRIDGNPFRIIGTTPTDVPPLPQTYLVVFPTRTICSFEGNGIRLTLTFMTPALPEDIEVLSRPVTYLTYEATAVDGREHQVQFYFDVSAEAAANDKNEDCVWSEETITNGLTALKVGTSAQAVLGKRGDDLRIDWGYLYAASPQAVSRGMPSVVLEGDTAQTFARNGLQFLHNAFVPKGMPAGVLSLAVFLDAGRVAARPVSRWLMLAYDDEFSIKYFRQNLRPYWRRNGDDAAALLKKAAADFEALKKRCENFDTELMADLRKAGGEKYAQLCALAYRQTFAGNKICADANGRPLMFPKENFSNGCIGTVDVLFPQAPFFLVLSPALTKAMLVPILDYAASPRWPYGYAPHDLGTYPHATGQVYGMNGGDGGRMPVEESGNMLIMLAALAKQQGNADLAKPYWPMLTRWADYLVREGLDPTNQLCSADMFGHLPHAANLALKAVIGIGGYAQLCSLAGKPDDAKKYLAIARDYAAKWQQLAKDDGRTRLAYHLPGTWGMKHNLIWDRVLGLDLFPESVGDQEIAWYLKVQNKYGLPVDNRTDTCLIDWALWSITPARKQADFQALLEPIWRYANETPNRVPLGDWFVTTTAAHKGMQARPVVGGLFIKMLAVDATWKRWATRGADATGPWAAGPVGAKSELPGLRQLMDTPLRDTSVCRGPDGLWYLTGTVEPFWSYNEGIKVWTSKDLTQWEPLGFVWKYGSSPWHKPYLEKKKPLWAPEIHYLKGTFWLTYSIPGWDGTGKTSGCGLLKSTSGKAEGPYEDVQPVERLGDEIDASLFQDDDGLVYFLWHSGKIARMKPDMSGLAEPYHWLKTTIPDPNPRHHSGLCAGIFGKESFDHVGFEGMFLFKSGGRYYLSCAEGYEGRYSCMVATSTNLYGPYGARYEAIPHGGHNMFFKDDKGHWWSSFFGSDPTAPLRERPAILPVRISDAARIEPE